MIVNKLPVRIVPQQHKTMTMKEAERDRNGHGKFLCECGNTLRQCRCRHNKDNPLIVYHITDRLCDDCLAKQPTLQDQVNNAKTCRSQGKPYGMSADGIGSCGDNKPKKSFDIVKYIRRRGNKWVVLSKKGDVLGTHDTKADAVRQLGAIESNKNKDLKHNGLFNYISKDSSKVRRARESGVLVDRRIQRYAEEHEEPDIARKIGGVWIKGDGPVDVEIKNKYGKIKHGIELKVVVDNNNDKITMHGSAEAKKAAWEKKHKATFHTVVIDDSGCVAHNLTGKETRRGKTKKIADSLERYLAGDKKAMDMSKRKIYYRRGFGSFRFHNMQPIKDFKELRHILDVPDDQLPKPARRKTQYKYNPKSSGERED